MTDDLWAANERLNLLLTLRRFREAEAFARECLARDPDWASGHTHLARALIGRGRKRDAIRAAKEGVGRDPHDPWCHGILAYCLDAAGQYDDALAAAEVALRCDPLYPWGYALVARIQANRGKHKRCREAARRGLELAPDDADLTVHLGWAELHLGRLKDAARIAQRGLTTHPTSAALHNLLGCVLWNRANRAWWRRFKYHRQADRHLAEAVRLDPGESMHRNNYVENAASARQCLIERIAMVGAVTLGALAWAFGTVLGVQHERVIAGAILFALGVLVSGGTVGRSKATALTAPLGWFDIPTVPVPEEHTLLGRLEWIPVVAVLATVTVVVSVIWTSGP